MERNNMAKLAILHLSDLHFGDDKNYDSGHVRNIINAIRNSVVDASSLLVVISGDLSYEGKTSQYADFDNFLNELRNSIETNYSNIKKIEIVSVPGNHDVDQTGGVWSKTELEEIAKEKLFEKKIDEEIAKGKNYHAFAKKRGISDDAKSLIEVKEFDFDGYSIKVNLINTSPFSARHSDDEGAHYIQEKTLERLDASEKDDYIFSVMHHPYYWFEWTSKHKLINSLIGSSDMVFLGHDHYQESYSINQDGLSTEMQASGQLSNLGNWHSSEFFIGLLDLSSRKYKRVLCHWDEAGKIYQTDKSSEFSLSKNRRNQIGLSVSKEFIDSMIIDNRFARGKDIRSYFVFPYIEEENNKGITIPTGVNSISQFIEILTTKRQVVLKGGKEAGKTITSTMIHLELNKQYVSVMLNSADFHRRNINPNNPKTEKIEAIITNAIRWENNCLEPSIERYYQLSQDEKAIIIDDFDLIDPSVQEALISYIKPRYGIILLTCQRDIIYDIHERARIDQLLDGFSEFSIWPFTGVKRLELIERVASVSGKDEGVVASTVDIVNNLLSNVKLLYRWDPSFIIQLTLYVCANSGSALKGEGDLFGDVVQATITQLITPALQQSKIGVESNYANAILELIAYNAHAKEEYPISFSTIEESIKEYNDLHNYHCPISEFISTMEKAYIIRYQDDRYEFTRNSYYAFFVSREMRRKCIDDGDTSIFERTINTAYKNINAYIILFFTYIMDSRALAKRIIDMAEQYTQQWDEFSISNPKQAYFKAIEIPEVVISGDEKYEQEWKQREEERANSRQMELMWIDPYKHDETDEDMLIGRAISLMIVISQMLPNLGHLLYSDAIDRLVDLVYRMPLKIFNYWATAIDNEKTTVIHDIQRINTLEYRDGLSTQKEMTSQEALEYLRKQSFSLLLELMNQSIVNASRQSTYEYLDNFTGLKDTSEISYEIEKLMSFEKRKNPGKCIDEFERVLKLCKPGAQKYMVQQIAKHYIIFSPNIDVRGRQRLYSSISNGAYPERLLTIERNRHVQDS